MDTGGSTAPAGRVPCTASPPTSRIGPIEYRLRLIAAIWHLVGDIDLTAYDDETLATVHDAILRELMG